jgi:Na+-driven multidrug efflux pump
LQQFWLVIKLSVGPIISMVFYMIVQLVNTYFIGHSDEASLIAGVGMGNMLINVMAFAVMLGLNGALETLVSQSFGASQNNTKSEEYRQQMRKNCGVFHNRARFVVTCVTVVIAVIFFYADKILVAIH